MDDTNILTFSRSTEQNYRVLEGANRTCKKWAATHGSAFSPDKYHLIYFSRKPRRFNMAAKIQIPGFEGNPEPLIKILGVHIDSKLRWGPHIKETSTKATRQCMSLTRLAASTWGASFTKARHIYTAVVRPVLTYRCGVWHTPEGTPGWRRTATKPLEKIQNQCLRTIAGAYKSTPTQTLEHETGIPPLPLHLDELTLAHSIRTREGPATAVIEATCRDIKAAARAVFSAKGIASLARGKLLKRRVNSLLSSYPPNAQKLPQRTQLRIVMREQWKERWMERARQEGRPVAQSSPWNPKIRHLHSNLPKPQSTLLTLLRTEHIGLEDYLSRRKVPDHLSPACPCGWHRQTPKHILLFCPHFQAGRAQMLYIAQTTDYHTLLTTKKGVYAATKWFLKLGLLGQFSLAKEMDRENQED